MEIKQKLGSTSELLQNELQGWFETFVKMLPNLVVAAIVIAAFWFVAKAVRTVSEKLVGRFSENEAVTKLLGTLNFLAVIVGGLFVSLGILDLDKTVTSLLAGAGVIGLVIGFAFQELGANFISGIFIAFRKPFKVRDVIRLGEYMGVVQRINLRATVIRTPQGQDIFIPNKMLLTEPVVNFTNDPRRQIELVVGVSYSDDLEEVEKTVLNALKNVDGCAYPDETQVFFSEFGDSSINFVIKMWIEFPGDNNYFRATHSMIKLVKKAFEEKGISIPFPMRTIEFQNSAGTSIQIGKPKGEDE